MKLCVQESRELDLPRRRPMLSLLPFSLSEMMRAIHSDLFSDVSQQIKSRFVTKGPLACIWYDDDIASIDIHQVLNHPDTPVDLFSLVLKHEFLHLRVPEEVVDGKFVQHPPAFWEAEKVIAPERVTAWSWIWWNLGACIRRNKKQERIDVRPN